MITGFSNKILGFGKKIIKNTTYPRQLRYLINISPLGVRISGENIKISRGCGFGGEISLGRGTEIGKNCGLYGVVETGPNVCIKKGSKLNGSINIKKRTRLQESTDVTGEVSFGKYSAVGRRSTFISNNHPISKPSTQFNFNREVIKQEFDHVTKGPISIGSDVWIGAETIVLSGVTVGHGAVIGAGSVVTNDIPPFSIAAGAPARQRGWRFNENIRDQLKDIEWWEWDSEKISKNKEFFSTDLTEVDDVHGIIE